jgi:hypothetical protein
MRREEILRKARKIGELIRPYSFTWAQGTIIAVLFVIVKT